MVYSLGLFLNEAIPKRFLKVALAVWSSLRYGMREFALAAI